jgi:hypothetical protein
LASPLRASAATPLALGAPLSMKTRSRGPLVAQTSVGRLAQPCGTRLTRESKSPANEAVLRSSLPGVVVPDSACHAGGRGFESRRSRLSKCPRVRHFHHSTRRWQGRSETDLARLLERWFRRIGMQGSMSSNRGFPKPRAQVRCLPGASSVVTAREVWGRLIGGIAGA